MQRSPGCRRRVYRILNAACKLATTSWALISQMFKIA